MMRTATHVVSKRARQFRKNIVKTDLLFSIIRQSGMMLFLALLTRAQLFGDIAPFSTACFCAALFAGWPALPMLLGCLLGGRYEVLGGFGLQPALSAMIVWVGYLIIRALPLKQNLKSSIGKTFFSSEDALCCALAGVGTLLPAFLFSIALPYNLIMAALSTFIAMLTAPVMISALNLRWSRSMLLPDEQISLSLLLMLSLLGVKGIPYVGAFLPPFLAALITIIAGGQRAGAGAMMGILTGTMLTLTGSDPFIGAALGLCGLLSGLVRRLGRPIASIAFALGNAMTVLYGMGYIYGALHPAGIFAVALVYCALPVRFLEKVNAWMNASGPGYDANQLAARVRANTEKRVRSLGAVFSELSAGYASSPETMPDEQVLVAQMRKRLCADCTNYNHCWNGSDNQASRMLCELLGTALKGEPITDSTQLPPELNKICKRGNQIPRKLGGMLTQFDNQRRAARERGACKDLMAVQFSQASEILDHLGDKLTHPFKVDEAMAHLTHAMLEREGIEAGEVLALDGDGLEVTILLKSELWNIEMAQKAARLLSREVGLPLRPAFYNGAYERELRLLESPRLSATVGIACRAAHPDTPCGDHHSATGLPGGRLMLALSDGMGNGNRAASESSSTIRLIRRFLAADVEREAALDAINGLLLMMSGEDMFATVDLCVLDLQSGVAEFNKLSACTSTVMHGGELIHIEGGRLPLGILEKVKPLNSSVELHPGDILIMTTDGIADSAKEGEQAWLDQVIIKHKSLGPQALCDVLIRAAVERDGNVRDDMTALAVRVGHA